MILDRESTLRKLFCDKMKFQDNSDKNQLSMELSEKKDGENKYSFDFRYYVIAPSLNIEPVEGVEIKKIFTMEKYIVVRGFVTISTL